MFFFFFFFLQRGSVELNPAPEGGHYASRFVNIARGSYEGQLVVGDSFIHPIKEFTVAKDDDIIVLQFQFGIGTRGREGEGRGKEKETNGGGGGEKTNGGGRGD